MAASLAMTGAPVSPVEPPHTSTWPELNLVPAASRRGTPSSTSSPIGRRAEPAQRLGGVAADALGVAGQQDAHVAAAIAQSPRDDEAVAPVVALAADDRHRPVGVQALDLAGDRGPRVLHELHAGDAALLDRPAVGLAHLLGDGQRLQPAHRMTATAPAIVR